MFEGVPRGDTPGEGEGGHDGKPEGVGGSPSSAGAAGGVTGAGSGATSGVGGTPKPTKGASFAHQ